MKRSALATVIALTAGVLAAPVTAVATQPDPAQPGPQETTTAAAEADTIPGSIVVRYEDEVDASVRARTEDAVAQINDVQIEAARSLDTQDRVVQLDDPAKTDQVIADLLQQPGVSSARPTLRLRTFTDPLTPAALPTSSWNLQGAPGGGNLAAARGTATGTGRVIAIVDSGITAHPDLSGRVLPGYDFIGSSAVDMARDGDGRDSDPTDQGDWEPAGYCEPGSKAKPASQWHGTHVSGIAAMAAPGAKILPLRALGACGGSETDVAAAITWAAGGIVLGAPANPTPADVINLSLGVEETCTDVLQQAITFATGRGAIVVTAAGNSGMDAAKVMPGNCSGVINVGSVGKNGAKASYSNYGTALTLSAPGGDTDATISSTSNHGTTTPIQPSSAYGLLGGTSQASPHVAATVAMMRQLNPALTRAQIAATLTSTARAFPVAPAVPMGAGILDAAAATRAITPAPSPAPTPTQSPAPSPTPTPTQSPTQSPTPTPTQSPTQSPTPTPTQSPAPNPTPVPSMPARVAGSDRVRTAVAASRTWWSTSKTVYLASAGAFPDALSAGPAAARDAAPLLLSPTTWAPSSVIAEILRLGADRVVIVGGTAAISTAVENQIRDLGKQTVRLAGTDRYSTNAAIAATFGSAPTAYLASGLAFADATNAAAAAATTGAPLLLTDRSTLPAATQRSLSALKTSRVHIVGGPAVIEAAVTTNLGTRAAARYAGANRYETAASLVDSIGSPGKSLIITNGENWPDSLVAGPVSAKTSSFMLPMRPTCTPPVISAAIAKLSPKTATILGGEGAVAEAARTRAC